MPAWIWVETDDESEDYWMQEGDPTEWEVDRRTDAQQRRPGGRKGERRTNDGENRIVR